MLYKEVDYNSDREWLDRVWLWMNANPALYLQGSGYTRKEELYEPSSAREVWLLYKGEPQVLVGFMAKGVSTQVAITANPQANPRLIVKLLQANKALLDGYLLPFIVAEVDSVARLAQLMGFKHLKANIYVF